MSDRVLHRRPFAQRGASTLGPDLGPQFVLALLILADAEASTVPACGFGTTSAQGTGVTGSYRKLRLLAWNHGDGLTARTGHLHPRKVQSEILLGEKRPHLRPRARDNVHTLLRPLGNPWAGHVSQVDIQLQQAGLSLQFLGQQLHSLMLRLVGRT